MVTVNNRKQKNKEIFSVPGLVGLVLAGIIALQVSAISRPALAASGQNGTTAADLPEEFNLDGYVPDQSLWAENMKLKYEKAKVTDEVPLALLSIDRLNLKAPVYMGTHRITLDRGLGVVNGTTLPGDVGNIAVSGHRDSFFRVLKDIKLGDTIEMQTLDGFEKFEVSDITIVDALEVSVLDPTDTTVLTLITCHPFYYQGYAPDRYIVRATPVGTDPAKSSHSINPEAIQPDASGANQ